MVNAADLKNVDRVRAWALGTDKRRRFIGNLPRFIVDHVQRQIPPLDIEWLTTWLADRPFSSAAENDVAKFAVPVGRGRALAANLFRGDSGVGRHRVNDQRCSDAAEGLGNISGEGPLVAGASPLQANRVDGAAVIDLGVYDGDFGAHLLIYFGACLSNSAAYLHKLQVEDLRIPWAQTGPAASLRSTHFQTSGTSLDVMPTKPRRFDNAANHFLSSLACWLALMFSSVPSVR